MANNTRIPLEKRFWAKVIKHEGCWEWIGAKKELGYGVISIGGRGGKIARASHVSWNIHNGQVPEGMWVLHKCDNPECTNPEHLFLGNAKDNNHDCITKGRHKFFGGPEKVRRGKDNNLGKLSANDVAEIRELCKELPPKRLGRVAFQTSIAKKYGIAGKYVTQLIYNRARILNES